MRSFVESEIRYLRRKITEWSRSNLANYPWRNTKNRWHALVAEIMLQRTNADQVLPVYLEFAQKYKTPSRFVAAKKTAVFASLGLLWREKPFNELAVKLAEKPIPKNKSELKALPCVGDYVSAAFISLHLAKREIIIDSNVVRLYGRFFGFDYDGETRRKKWLKELAEKITPRRNFKDFNYGVIDLTRTFCKNRPLCNDCPLNRKCSSKLD